MRTRRLRILQLCVSVGVIVLIVHAIAAIGLHFNFTPSMPLGIYRLAPLSRSGVERGSFVAVCAPPVAAKLGRRRGYLAIGACPSHAEPLLKVVAAVPGDQLAVSADGVAVNGCALPHSQPLNVDSAGRRLSRWPRGHYRLRRGQLWLYAANNRSWDSRYWGPAMIRNVLAQAEPLIIMTSGLRPPERSSGAVVQCSARSAGIESLIHISRPFRGFPGVEPRRTLLCSCEEAIRGKNAEVGLGGTVGLGERKK